MCLTRRGVWGKGKTESDSLFIRFVYTDCGNRGGFIENASDCVICGIVGVRSLPVKYSAMRQPKTFTNLGRAGCLRMTRLHQLCGNHRTSGQRRGGYLLYSPPMPTKDTIMAKDDIDFVIRKTPKPESEGALPGEKRRSFLSKGKLAMLPPPLIDFNNPLTADLVARNVIANQMDYKKAIREVLNNRKVKSATIAGLVAVAQEHTLVQEKLERLFKLSGLDDDSQKEYVTEIWGWFRGNDKQLKLAAGKILAERFVKQHGGDEKPVELPIRDFAAGASNMGLLKKDDEAESEPKEEPKSTTPVPNGTERPN